jgi:hypothetical protein
VRLTVNPDTGSTFTGWTTGPCMLGVPCVVVMDTDQTIVSNFDLAPDRVTLSVDKPGGGERMATRDPAGMPCGPACASHDVRSTVLTLMVLAANVGARFDERRERPCHDVTGACVPTMDRNRTANTRLLGVSGG